MARRKCEAPELNQAANDNSLLSARYQEPRSTMRPQETADIRHIRIGNRLA